MPNPFDIPAGQLGNLAGIVATPAAPTPIPTLDPVVNLYAQWVAAREASEEMNHAHWLLADALVRRWGVPIRDKAADCPWCFHPDAAEAVRLGDESDRLYDMTFAIEAKIIAAKPTTLEGVRCKLKIAIYFTECLQQQGKEFAYGDYVQLALMRGVERALAGVAHP